MPDRRQKSARGRKLLERNDQRRPIDNGHKWILRHVEHHMARHMLGVEQRAVLSVARAITVFCAMFAHGGVTGPDSFPYLIAKSRQIGPILVLCRRRLLESFFGDLRFFLFLGADMLVSLLFS